MTVIIILVGAVVANWVPLNHAKKMITFVEYGERTGSPEELSFVEKLPLLFLGITVPRPENEQTPADFGLAYEAQVVVSEDQQLEVWKLEPASNRPNSIVILFHGYAESKASLLPIAISFYEMEHEVWLVDFRGSGGSSGNQTTVGYQEAKDVAAIYHEAREQSPDQIITLYGMSMGGAAILRAVATEGIKPDKLIIESVFDSMLSTVKNRFHSMGLPAFPAANLLVFWGGVEMGINAFEHQPVEYATHVEMPILMLHGEQDPRATLDEGRRVFDAIKAKQKSFVVFGDAGHHTGHEADKELWEREVRVFLASFAE